MVLFSGLACAQSSVTLYGIIDSGLLYTSKTANSSTGGNSGKQFSLIDSGSTPSEFGMEGTEDLGGGLKAKFKLENGFSTANGGAGISNGNFFGRQAWVSLESNLGELKTGLQFSPFFLALYRLDPRGLSTFGSSSVIYADSVVATGVFDSNAVSYTSPAISGFTGSVLYALGGEAGNFSAGRNYSADLMYNNGTLMIDAAFYDGNPGGTAQTPVPTNVGFIGRMLGASYKFESFTFKASYTSYKIAGSFSNNVYGGGVNYDITPALDVNGGVWYTTDRNNSSNHSILAALGTQYALSRSTSLYGQIGIVNNHGKMNTGLSINGATQEVAGTTVGAVVGIRHLF
ncbi:porin [Paraburkholderia sp. 1N]|uniref:Porin n=2 Tax=Paraburkholderia solitsugae TaxID=2675748 RepID=A0ABX2BZY7_9BURK|nr:porin [Paraburkholderia solitsugae]NPT46294.1 porin [Paraburkholderia solitsugae]